jgi:hypothetical protein
MPQHFRLDRLTAVSYLGLAAAACASAGVGKVPPSVIPVDVQPMASEQVKAMVAATQPDENQRLRLKFKFRDKKGQVGGNGGVSIAVPDSLRLDMRGPLGLGKGAAMVVGDSAVWLSGADVIERIVPDYRLFWGMLGVARQPPDTASLRGSVVADTTSWEYAIGQDTVEYVRRAGESLTTLVRRGGKLVGRAETKFANGLPASSQLLVPGTPARLDITFTEVTRPATIKPDIWVRPEP